MSDEKIRLTRPWDEALKERYADTVEAQSLLEYGIEMLLSGEDDEAKTAFGVLVRGRIGFEEMSRRVGIPARSINRMLSDGGNPSLANLSAILKALHEELGVEARWTLVKDVAA